jgi:DNA-binding NarL/FixJ family response regulator
MRVLIVADSVLGAEAIRRELRHTPACGVVGYVDGRGPCGSAIEHAAADVVLIDDMRMPERGLARIREARSVASNLKLVLLTARMDSGWLAEASEAGVDAALSKSMKPGVLGVLLREVVAGNVYHAFVAPAPVVELAKPLPADLTARELEVLRFVASGATNSQIAAHLWVTEQTVKFHLSNVYRKLGVTNRTQAGHLASMRGFVKPAVIPTATAATAAA